MNPLDPSSFKPFDPSVEHPSIQRIDNGDSDKIKADIKAGMDTIDDRINTIDEKTKGQYLNEEQTKILEEIKKRLEAMKEAITTGKGEGFSLGELFVDMPMKLEALERDLGIKNLPGVPTPEKGHPSPADLHRDLQRRK